MTVSRNRWRCPSLGVDHGSSQNPSLNGTDRFTVAEDDEGFNLWGSTINATVTPELDSGEARAACERSMHMVTLDIDHPARLVESQTPGHYHLFIDVPMTWEAYQKIITALSEAGVIEPGYAAAANYRRATFVASEPWKKARVGVEVAS